MRKGLYAVILAVILTITMSSCGKSGKHIEDFDFIKKNEIPISDINIAYIYDGTMYLENDLICLKSEMFLSKEQLYFCDIAGTEDYGIIYNRAMSVGANLIILDKNINDEFAEYGIKKYNDVKFLFYSNSSSLSSDNLIKFSDDFLPYSYILGVITAKKNNNDNIGVFADNSQNAKQFAAINSFAAGVKAANQNAKLTVSDSQKKLSDAKCADIYIPYTSENSLTGTNTIGFDEKCNVNLKSNRAYFFKSVLESMSSGDFKAGDVKVGINYGLCKDGLSELIPDDDFRMQIDSICGIFENKTPVFSENAIMLSGDGIVTVSEKVKDNKGNTVIDSGGNYFVYNGDELVKCESYNELVNEKMNYYLDNIEEAG